MGELMDESKRVLFQLGQNIQRKELAQVEEALCNKLPFDSQDSVKVIAEKLKLPTRKASRKFASLVNLYTDHYYDGNAQDEPLPHTFRRIGTTESAARTQSSRYAR
ncbi:hypothetical protein [Quatrionicoccus australiensis]|uniref:hypothetical protein n=1 Tax=Quatrionicoccus australiensis TaxID=138118 RepID=UPI001CFC1029|nr:hypothetical protein [Quatrionicoccus australiensis]MCB4362085.1 hypothetical protein [Quatrionicoccus australiensis]